MPISEKITQKIAQLNIESDVKDLMLAILTVEDAGKQYTAIYQTLVDKYLEKKETDNNGTNN